MNATSRRVVFVALVVAAISLLSRFTSAESIPQGWKAQNVQPVGYSRMEGRYPFKLTMKQSGWRWYLYAGHLGQDGFSIVDVTDPRHPVYVTFVPGTPNSWTNQMTLHGDLLLTNMQRRGAHWGGDPSKPASEGLLVWDISDPLNPKELARWSSGALGGTHRNAYPGGKYAYLSSTYPGYQGGRILVILDVSDPRNPKVAGKWAQPGMNKTAGEVLKLDTPYGFHGPAMVSPDGTKLILGFSPGVIVLDISDPSNPKEIGRLDFSPPFNNAAAQAVHSVLPLWDRHLLCVSSEPDIDDCNEGLNLAGLIDIKDITRPRLMSLFPLPQPPAGEHYKNFCEKGGRFGPHNVNQEIHLPEIEKPGDLIYLTYHNAALRIFDIKDPVSPKETGWFIPPPLNRRPPPAPDIPVQQRGDTSDVVDVLVDTRGYIYASELHGGLFTLKYTGPDQPKPTAK
jgi:hypothetical protein